MAFKLFDANRELQKKEEFLTSVIENIPDIIFIKDSKNLKFVRVNKSCKDFLSCNEDEILGKDDYDFFPKEQADFFSKSNRDVLKTGILLDISEAQIDTKKRKPILHTKKIPLYNKEGKPDFLLGISEDITERKKIENALRKNEESLEKAQNLAHMGNWEYYPATGEGYWSKEMYHIFNYDMEKGIPPLDKFIETVHSDEAKNIFESHKRVMATGISETFSYRKYIENYGYRYFETSIHLINENNGSSPYLAGIVIDVTDKKNSEIVLSQANDLLLRQKKSLSILNEIIIIANQAENLPSLYKNILNSTLRLLDYDAGGIYIINNENNTANVVYSKNLPSDFLNKIKDISITNPRYSDIFIKGMVVITDHYEKISPEYAKIYGFCSVISVPLYSKNRIVGALNAISKKRYIITEDEKNVLITIGRELGTIIERITVEEELKKSEANLNSLFNNRNELIWTIDKNYRALLNTR